MEHHRSNTFGSLFGRRSRVGESESGDGGDYDDDDVVSIFNSFLFVFFSVFFFPLLD